MTLDTMMGIVALVAGGKASPSAVDAQAAVHMALDKIDSEEWNYYRGSDTTLVSVAGTATVALPADFRSPLSLRVTAGSTRILQYVEHDRYNRFSPDQTSNGLPTHYTLTQQYSDTLLTLLPTPDTAESFELVYVRWPAKSTTGGSALDIASYMERMIILDAQTLVGTWRQLRSEKIRELAAMAEAARRDARARDRDISDTEPVMVSQYETTRHLQPWPFPSTDDPSVGWY